MADPKSAFPAAASPFGTRVSGDDVADVVFTSPRSCPCGPPGAGFEVPRSVEFREELPLNAMGTVMKDQLR
ncbi:hypothetical protein ABZ642_21240 [Streptomyces sp. NPDC007157]|uniref:hypothetical protein n=1 Tax=Streptomyces sp. NPDC007157 TaxID=3154681 RepID=UPI0033D6AA01